METKRCTATGTPSDNGPSVQCIYVAHRPDESHAFVRSEPAIMRDNVKRPFTTVGIYPNPDLVPDPKLRHKSERFFIIGQNGNIRDVTNKRDLKPSEVWRFHEVVSFAFYAGKTVSITLARVDTFDETQHVTITLPRHII